MTCAPFTSAQVRRVRARSRIARQFSASALRKGMNVEREHKNIGACHSPLLAARIALAHLRERPDYYERLKKFVER